MHRRGRRYRTKGGEYSARIRWTDVGGKRGGAAAYGILRGMGRLHRLKPPGAEALAARGIEKPLCCAGWMLPGETCDGTRSAGGETYRGGGTVDAL